LADSQNAVICKPDAAVELYYDNVKKLETTSNGVKINESGSGNGELRINGATGNTEGIVFERGGTEASRISHSNSADLVFSMGSSVSTKLKLTSGGNFQIPNDNAKLQLGASQDLQIYHNGSHSFIDDTGTGDLYIRGDNSLKIQNAAGSEQKIVAISNGSVEIYYDHSKKFETTSTGTTTTGQSKVDVDTNLNSATEYNGQDFGFLVSYDGGSSPNDEGNGICFAQKYYDQDAATIRTGAIIGYKTSGNGSFGGGLKFKVQQSGANPLVEMLRMKNDRIDIPQDVSLYLGASSDLRLYHDGTDSFLLNATGEFQIANSGNGNTIFLQAKAGENSVRALANGATELYYDGGLKLDTRSSGVGISGDLFFVDSTRIYMGSSNDFQLFHDGTNTHIVNTTGNLVYRSDTHHFKDKDNSDTHAKFVHDGAVELYHDNAKKLETTANGITVTGSVTTQDMNMSNLNGSANEVDNTKGSWSIQEGSDDLFIINRVTGKKYKFNLTEIS